jgi:uncharacterized membrane protein
MSTVPDNTVPSTREFTLLGITYGLYAFGLVVFWPVIAGVVLAYIRRADAKGTFLESHYGWLIRTFWWWAILFVLIICGLLSAVLPGAIQLGKAAQADGINIVNIPWKMIGGAIAGGIALAVVWFWVIYRLVRGLLRLGDGRAVP